MIETALSSLARGMFLLDPWKQFHQIAGLMIEIELREDDLLHPQQAGSGAPRQQEHDGVAAHAGVGPRLNRRGADLRIAQPTEQFAESRNRLREQGSDGVGRDIALSDAGPPR